MRQGLSYCYGALTEHLDDDQRADVDAILNGLPRPSEVRAEAEMRARRQEFALAGEIG